MISPNPESILCHCLRITVGQVQCAITERRQSSLRDVMRATGAGKGCMSCHARIRAMLAGRSPVSTFVIPACPGCTNPACGCAAKACGAECQTVCQTDFQTGCQTERPSEYHAPQPRVVDLDVEIHAASRFETTRVEFQGSAGTVEAIDTADEPTTLEPTAV